MANHYYSENPETAHDLHQWSFELAGRNFQFVTDSGVFSRDTVDYGSRVLIEHFDAEELPEGTLLDVGCGYGPIGMALAYQTGRSVEMIDVNNRAVELAQGNAKRNGIEADIAGKKVVHQILSDAEPLLKDGGTLTIVIQKKQGAPSAKSKMEEVFGNAEIVAKDKGYYIIHSVKE